MNLEISVADNYIYSPILEKKDKLELSIHEAPYKKWIYLSLIVMSSTCSTVTTTLFLPAIKKIKQDLLAENYEMDLMLSLFLITSGLSPLFWGNLAEYKGVKKMYIISTLITILSCIIGSFAGSVTTLTLMRILLGIGTSASRVIGTAYIIHFFAHSNLKDWALQAYFVSPMLGSSLGPIFGGYITTISWRLSFKLMIIIQNLILILILVIFPKGNKEKDYIANRNIKKSLSFFIFPYEPIKFLKYKSVVSSTYIISIAFTTMNAIIAITPVFMTLIYNMSISQIGWCYFPVFLGGLSAVFIINPIVNFLSNNLQIKFPKLKIKALLIALIAPMIILISTLIVMGYILINQLPYSWALVCLFLISLSSNSVVSGMSNFVVLLFPNDSNVVSSLPSSLRSIIACIVTSFDSTIIYHLNYNGFMCFVAALNFISLLIIVVFIYSK